MKSKSGELNTQDWKAAGKAALVWSAPVLLIYISAVLGVVQVEGHKFVLTDFIPSEFTVHAIVTWALMQVQGILLRLVSGK